MLIDNVPHAIAACCALRNVCEINHESFNEEWLREVVLDQPDSEPSTSMSSSSGVTSFKQYYTDGLFNQNF